MSITESNLNAAAQLIKQGKLVAFPSETVYGLGADATNEDACSQIFSLKGRPSHNPLIIHIQNMEQASRLGRMNEWALKLAAKFWPGPLTMIVERDDQGLIAKNALAGLDTIALRLPAHPVALKLLALCDRPLAAPSANLSGHISPTAAEHVIEDFGDKVYVLDAGVSACGLESTIIDLTTVHPTVLRPGFITLDALSQVLGLEARASDGAGATIKAPGMLKKHYAPTTPLRLEATHAGEQEVGLGFGINALSGPGSLNLSPSGDLIEAASNLYTMLRMLDKYACQHRLRSIAVADIPFQGIGIAINDRLLRAACRED